MLADTWDTLSVTSLTGHWDMMTPGPDLALVTWSPLHTGGTVQHFIFNDMCPAQASPRLHATDTTSYQGKLHITFH